MKTNIVIDAKLMEEALYVSGCKTKKETAEEGLKLLVTMDRQAEIRQFCGNLKWEGNLDKMRTNK